MKRTASLVLGLLVVASSSLFAQEEEKAKPSWKKEVVGLVNLSQVQFDNWKQGGENTVAWQANVNANFTKDVEKYSWANTGKLSFGQTKVGKNDLPCTPFHFV